MELQLGLALPTNPSFHKKRSFSQLFDDHAQVTTNSTDVMLPTLSLLPGHPNHDDDPHEERSHCSTITTKNDEDDVEALVGWPPVSSWRKKLRFNNYDGDEVAGNDHVVLNIDHNHGGHGSVGLRGSKSLYVKVKMEGVGIARKVDLIMHHSFQTLKETLMDMFGKCGHQQSNSYELAYQDEEGDWLLAEDVPWRSFIKCAQRLKLLKSRG
ncbi:auxin-responsive protein IAA29-like [Gastrolobium bilobum]|uniref:auxin-responsive protein IAA29-like n=1 Tax=Gastrolobium bilobum TaxID=150636 RepID=UPI002AB1E464|nr:auxin-responsive protein IAA29-like [Gastrolobium bilobum]